MWENSQKASEGGGRNTKKMQKGFPPQTIARNVFQDNNAQTPG